MLKLAHCEGKSLKWKKLILKIVGFFKKGLHASFYLADSWVESTAQIGPYIYLKPDFTSNRHTNHMIFRTIYFNPY